MLVFLDVRERPDLLAPKPACKHWSDRCISHIGSAAVLAGVRRCSELCSAFSSMQLHPSSRRRNAKDASWGLSASPQCCCRTAR